MYLHIISHVAKNYGGQLFTPLIFVNPNLGKFIV